MAVVWRIEQKDKDRDSGSIPAELLERGLLSNGCKNGRDEDGKNDDSQTLPSIEQPIMHNYSHKIRTQMRQNQTKFGRRRGKIGQKLVVWSEKLVLVVFPSSIGVC